MLNGWYNWAQANKAMLQLPYNMTMALMGLFIAFAIAYHLADEYEMQEIFFKDANIPDERIHTTTMENWETYDQKDSIECL